MSKLREDLLMVLKAPEMFGVTDIKTFEVFLIGYEYALDNHYAFAKRLTKWTREQYLGLSSKSNLTFGTILATYSKDWKADIKVFLNDYKDEILINLH